MPLYECSQRIRAGQYGTPVEIQASTPKGAAEKFARGRIWPSGVLLVRARAEGSGVISFVELRPAWVATQVSDSEDPEWDDAE